MGIDPNVDIDYKSLAAEPGDIFLFITDGISGHVTDNRIRQLINEHGDDLQACANSIVEEALQNGSRDNVTCQLLSVVTLPTQTEADILQKITELPFPPFLGPGMTIDGYEILRELHATRRSEVFLALDHETGTQVILKTPSINYRDEPAYLDGFLHEEWIGKRIDNSHVLKVLDTPKRRFLYNISEHIEGQTLRQWIDDHPQTHINKARAFLHQIAEGLRAFHRLEMIHLDMKPENIIIDAWDTLKIIDFGSTRVAGTAEITTSFREDRPQGTINYSAPECQEGYCSNRSDIFSLGVIAYELLTGKLPYGNHDKPLKAARMKYISALTHNKDIQPWVDGALEKAVHPNPRKRYATLSEFLHDLSHPNKQLMEKKHQPLLERNPIGFWRSASIVLFLLNLYLLYLLFA